MIDPLLTAARWYFGELNHADLPSIAVEALEQGHDGRMLRRLAGLVKPTSRDVRVDEIDGAFRELGIAAPLTMRDAQLILSTETARAATSGMQNPFDAATHIRIGICGCNEEPAELARIVRLSKEAENAPRHVWSKLERKILTALSDFLSARQ